MNKKILYVEDDETLSYLTVDNLQLNDFNVFHCEDGKKALATFKSSSFDLCILDIMLPEMDGFELAEQIRKLNSEIPILFLSAKSLKEDRIKGLKLGADDYLVKPFSIEELLLKIHIFLSRPNKSSYSTENRFSIGEIVFDYSNLLLIRPNDQIKLTKKEADVLKMLLHKRNQVIRREELLMEIWGDDDYFKGRSLDVFISRLRKYLINEENSRIENVHGIGFKFIQQ